MFLRNRIISYIVALILFFIFITIFLFVYMTQDTCNFFSGFVATSFAAFFSLLLVLVGWNELNKIHATSNADLLHKLKRDFFQDESRILLNLIEYQYINFVVKNTRPDGEEICYFEVDTDKIMNSNFHPEIKDLLTKRKSFTTNEMDDFVLGHFEDIGMFWEKGVLDIDLIYEEFEDYITVFYESEIIQEYLRYCNGPEGADQNDYYDKFKRIYQECKAYGKKKKKR